MAVVHHVFLTLSLLMEKLLKQLFYFHPSVLMRVNKCIVNVFQIYREFLQISTVPLLSTFFTELDWY